MRFIMAMFLTIFIWAGFVYESDHEVIVLNNKVVEVHKSDDGSTIYKEIKPVRVNDGNFNDCPNCKKYHSKDLTALKGK